MKKSLLLSLIVLTGMIFYAGTSPGSKPKVKMLVHILQHDTSEYFYNPDGHISRIRNSKGNDIVYTYLPGMILKKYYDAGRGKAFTDTLHLNKKGLVDRLTSSNTSSIGLSQDFDSNGYVIHQNYLDTLGNTKDTRTCKYENGNLSTEIDMNSSGAMTFSWKNQYYTDHLNTIGSENLGSDFVGASPRNPVKYSQMQMIGTKSTNWRYNYHYDDKGRIVIMAVYDLNTKKLADSNYYTYYSGVYLELEK